MFYKTSDFSDFFAFYRMILASGLKSVLLIRYVVYSDMAPFFKLFASVEIFRAICGSLGYGGALVKRLMVYLNKQLHRRTGYVLNFHLC